MIGKILSFRPAGFGFLQATDGSDFFVHRSNVEGDRRPEAGDLCEFELGPGYKDPAKKQAINVKVVRRSEVIQ